MGRLSLFAVTAFLLALLPRLSPLVAGTLFADDFVHVPRGHLESYRFLNAIELAFWQWVIGPGYLQTFVPKVVGAIYTAALMLLLRVFLLRANLPVWPVLLVPLHPLWNVFVAWNVCAVYPLSLVLIVGGYLLLMDGHRTLGIVLIAFGVSGYQVHAGLLPALWMIDRNWRRAAWSCAGIAVYLIVTQLFALAGLATWGGRGLSLATLQFKAAIDNLAVLTQPLLSFYGSEPVAWRFWWLPFVLLAIALRKSAWQVAAPVVAALVIVPLNVAATGPRVTAAIWIALLLAVAPLLRNRIAVAVVALVLLPITLVDAHNRTVAWRIDLAIRKAMHGRVIYAFGGKAAQMRGRPIVMQNFHSLTPREYSNVIHWPEWFFDDEEPGRANELQRIDGRTPFASWQHEGETTYLQIHR